MSGFMRIQVSRKQSWAATAAAAVSVLGLAALAAIVPEQSVRAAGPAMLPEQGVQATGLITYGAGTCFPDAVLLDCDGNVIHQLRGPGGAGFFSPYVGLHVELTGAEQECQPGQPYLDVVQIVAVADPCGAPTPTPDVATPTPGGQPPPPPVDTPTPVGPAPTPAPANLALGKQLFASTTQPGFDPHLAADGDPATHWASFPGRDPYYAARNIQWIYIDLEAEYSVQRMRMLWNQWRHARGYIVYAWLDHCGGWCRLASTDRGKGDDTLELIYGPVEARYFMLWLVNPGLIGGHYELVEWEIEGQASIMTTNVAAGKGAVALNQLPGFEAGNVTDADDATEWRSATVPSWIYVNLGTGIAVDRAQIKWSLGQHATQYGLYAWNGWTWIPLTANSAGGGGDEMVRFPAVRTQYVLLYAAAGPGPGVGIREFEIYEVRAPGAAPYPDAVRTGIWQGLSGGGRPNVVPDGVIAQPASYLESGVAPQRGDTLGAHSTDLSRDGAVLSRDGAAQLADLVPAVLNNVDVSLFPVPGVSE